MVICRNQNNKKWWFVGIKITKKWWFVGIKITKSSDLSKSNLQKMVLTIVDADRFPSDHHSVDAIFIHFSIALYNLWQTKWYWNVRDNEYVIPTREHARRRSEYTTTTEQARKEVIWIRNNNGTKHALTKTE